MKRRLLLASLVLVATATCLFAGKPGVVRTGDGETYEGEVTETPESITVRVHGVDTVLSRDRVASIDYATYADRFESALARLESDDVEGRVKLAREAFDRHEYAAALKAVGSALDINPLDRDARQLESTISTQIQLENKSKKPATDAPESETDADAADPATKPTVRRYRGLDDEQANRVRQLELSLNDNVHVQFRDNVRKRYVDSQPDMSYRAFASRGDVDQAKTIINRGTPEMIEDVVIRDNPFSVQSFGHSLQTALVKGCASSNCHGGSQAGAFRLMTGTPDASTLITNFYLVTQYAQKMHPASDELFAPTSVPLVDRGNAKKSLLYQYALPRSRATLKHPVVRGWDGLFRSDDERLALAIVQWMDKDLGRLDRDYGFTFVVPERRGATTTPSTEASSEPTTMPDVSDR